MEKKISKEIRRLGFDTETGGAFNFYYVIVEYSMEDDEKGFDGWAKNIPYPSINYEEAGFWRFEISYEEDVLDFVKEILDEWSPYGITISKEKPLFVLNMYDD